MWLNNSSCSDAVCLWEWMSERRHDCVQLGGSVECSRCVASAAGTGLWFIQEPCPLQYFFPSPFFCSISFPAPCPPPPSSLPFSPFYFFLLLVFFVFKCSHDHLLFQRKNHVWFWASFQFLALLVPVSVCIFLFHDFSFCLEYFLSFLFISVYIFCVFLIKNLYFHAQIVQFYCTALLEYIGVFRLAECGWYFSILLNEIPFTYKYKYIHIHKYTQTSKRATMKNQNKSRHSLPKVNWREQ